MELYGQYDSPFVRRVAVALQLYALPYDHKPWSVFADAEALAEVNPMRRVPVLRLDAGENEAQGEVLFDSAAILDALDDLVGPERALLPRTGPARRAGLRIAALATSIGDKAVSLVYERLLHDTVSPVWVDRCRAQLRDGLAWLERSHAQQAERGAEFWLGHLSHADIAVTCVLRFLREAHPEAFRSGTFPGVEALAARCEELPAFRAVVQPFHVALKT